MVSTMIDIYFLFSKQTYLLTNVSQFEKMHAYIKLKITSMQVQNISKKFELIAKVIDILPTFSFFSCFQRLNMVLHAYIFKKTTQHIC